MRALHGLPLLLCIACAAAPEPIPFRGPAPTRIAILPLRGEGLPDSWRRALDDSAHLAVGARGYGVVPAAVVATDPVWSAADDSTMPELLARFDADAVLERTSRVVGATVDPAASRIDIVWRIHAGSPLAVIWEWRSDLRPGAVTSEHLTGPLGLRSDDPLLSDEQIQGRGYGSNVTQVRALTSVQIAEDVQHRLSERLPLREK